MFRRVERARETAFHQPKYCLIDELSIPKLVTMLIQAETIQRTKKNCGECNEFGIVR